MAMRPRASGIATVRTRPVMRPANENFKPKSEWKHEEGASILSVYLPGFVKEQMKLTIDDKTSLIRVQGQRPLPNARWIRFNEGFSIPENCDITKINSQFGSGILRITMPKIVTTQISPKEETKTTQEVLKKDQEDSSPKASSTTNVEKQRDDQNVKAQIPQKPASEPKPEMGLEVTPPKAMPTPSTEKQRVEQSVKALSPPKSTREPNSQKGEEVTPLKATLTTGIKDDKKELEVLSPEKVESKPKSQNGQDETSPKTISTTNAKEQKVENSIGSKSVDQNTDEKKEKGEANGTGTPTVPQMPGDHEEKAKEDSTTAELKEMEMVTAASMKALKDLAMGLIHERQLAVNISTAVLVIVGLGAYILYSLGS